jgi:oligoribonuclease NrnB/cAMP/cGMP phosphodiesterase (DHH superfamily)
MEKPVDVVIYHKDCPDGYSAAFVLLMAGYISETTFIRPDVPHANAAPEVYGNIIIVDVAYKPEVLQSIIDQSKSVLFIDHHKTHIDAILDMEKNQSKLTVIYDVNECGSTLAWHYCFPSIDRADHTLPLYLRMIRDNDIGRWKILDSRPLITAIDTDFELLPTIESLEKIHPLFTESGLREVLVRGRLYYKYRELVVRRAMRYGAKLSWGKYKVAFVNIAGSLASETATRLAREDPSVDFAVAFHYNIEKRSFIYSMRSDTTKSSGVVDVEMIARKRGGGGHVGAAAFEDKYPPDKVVKKQAGGNKIIKERIPCKDNNISSSFTSELDPFTLIKDEP